MRIVRIRGIDILVCALGLVVLATLTKPVIAQECSEGNELHCAETLLRRAAENGNLPAMLALSITLRVIAFEDWAVRGIKKPVAGSANIPLPAEIEEAYKWLLAAKHSTDTCWRYGSKRFPRWLFNEWVDELSQDTKMSVLDNRQGAVRAQGARLAEDLRAVCVGDKS